MAGDAPSMGALAWRAPRPVEVGACGRAAFPGRTKRWPSPQPFPPAGEGARRHAARSSGADEPKAEPSDGPSGRYLPSGRAEKRRAWGGRGSAACRASCSDLLRMFERRERSEQSEFRSAAPRPSIAGCPQRSGGTRPVGSPFSLVTFFWRDKKKVTAPPGAHPGQQRPQHPNKIKRQWPSQTPPPCATQTSESSPSTSSAAPRTRCSAAP